jgi:hypothetical protein
VHAFFVARAGNGLFPIPAKNSTADPLRKTALPLAKRRFSTNPQHSSQQQDISVFILKQKFVALVTLVKFSYRRYYAHKKTHNTPHFHSLLVLPALYT